MGKKHAISGLSRFVSEAFSSTTPVAENTSDKTTDATAVAGTSRTVSSRKDDSTEMQQRPSKKRKVGLLGTGNEKYDATGLVPFYTHASEVPSHLQKYFSQRERYFSLYSSGCLLDEEGWYSVTPERIADQIAERCRCDVVLDAFCGVGGNAIAFARTCERVIALDTSPVRLALARHNAALYGVADRIEFVLADFLSFARTLAQFPHSPPSATTASSAHDDSSSPPPTSRNIDVVFLSPPWGGPSYLTDSPSADTPHPSTEEVEETTPSEYSLSIIRPVHGRELFQLARKITRNVAYFLPRNMNLQEVAALVAEDGHDAAEANADGEAASVRKGKNRKGKGKKNEMEMVEVEEEWMGHKLKALTCYFGGLVAGQEDLFYS